MSNSLPLVAAVPNFNMAQQLKTLLPKLAALNYDAIYVLDDCSTDGSHEMVDEFNSGRVGVTFVSAFENRGAGAARNLMQGKLAKPWLIHFIDADVDILSQDMPAAVRDAIPTDQFGFLGGLVLTNNGKQSVWNYGPRQGLRADMGGALQLMIEPLLTSNPRKAQTIRTRFRGLLKEWPDPLADPKRRQVFWSVESNLVVQSEVFERLGGFDERLREHEIQDLAIRMDNRGLPSFFDPTIAVAHKNEQNVRHYNRTISRLHTEYLIARKHGLLNWLTQ